MNIFINLFTVIGLFNLNVITDDSCSGIALNDLIEIQTLPAAKRDAAILALGFDFQGYSGVIDGPSTYVKCPREKVTYDMAYEQMILWYPADGLISFVTTEAAVNNDLHKAVESAEGFSKKNPEGGPDQFENDKVVIGFFNVKVNGEIISYTINMTRKVDVIKK